MNDKQNNLLELAFKWISGRGKKAKKMYYCVCMYECERKPDMLRH